MREKEVIFGFYARTDQILACFSLLSKRRQYFLQGFRRAVSHSCVIDEYTLSPPLPTCAKATRNTPHDFRITEGDRSRRKNADWSGNRKEKGEKGALRKIKREDFMCSPGRKEVRFFGALEMD